MTCSAIRGNRERRPKRASPMSGLLSATMIFSAGTEFGLSFPLVQIHDRDLKASQFIGK